MADEAAALEEKARLEAEARRQKILDGAGNRMDLVTGIQSKDDDGAEKPKSSSSSRLAAMRRRRFKKGGAAKKEETASTTESTEADKPTTDAADTAKPAETEKATETSKPAEPVKAAEPAKVEEPSKIEAKSEPEKVEETPTSATESTAAEDAGAEAAPKKKYMGVAKMRRKMNKERQAKAEEERERQAKEAPASQSASPKDSAAKAVLKPRRKVSAVPITMYIVTVLMLFLAGLDIGLQQNKIEYALTGVVVHDELAPKQELRILNIFSGWSSKKETPKSFETSDPLAYDAGAEEEFDADDDGTKKTDGKNIDPLFQVDLDALTAGPGLFMMMGRFAVACHRLNLSVFYYWPLSMFAKMASLLQSPPMLCIIALAIRQAIGKTILGADLPAAVEDESQHKDVMSMVKSFVKNFILRAFPTAANLYDAWVHLRADMYVILCGLFVGIAWHHQFRQSFSLEPEEIGTDEPEPVPETGVASDEL